jgi:hypothetical protein
MLRAIVCSLLGLILVEGTGRADANFENVLGGAVLGVAFRDQRPSVLVGVEGGVGVGPERVNLGFTHRADEVFVYGELDPWLLVGASIGAGYGTTGGPQPVVGFWVGMPYFSNECPYSWRFEASLSIGYRYTGVHEVYVTPKVGMGKTGCID